MKYSLNVLYFLLIFVVIECRVSPKDDLITDETEGEIYLNATNTELAKQLRIFTLAQWNYATNINDETSAAQIEATKNFNDFQKKQSEQTLKYNWTNFKEYNQRQFEKLAVIGTSALDKEDEDRYTNVTNQMETFYSSATVNINGKDLPLDPGLEDIMASSTDYDLLSEVWVKWRDASGKKMRNDFITYYTLGNKAATENVLPNMKFDTLDDLWLFPWETPTIKSDTADLWNQLKPFYEKIHAYVRMKLNIKYPGKLPKDGTIPAHLLGNMWAQQWSNIMNATGLDPYPDVPPIDVSESLKDQNKTALDMFHMSDEFFANLGLENMTQLFWNNSVLVKKDNVTMVCHASAWDFYTTDDFRIKQCTDINMEDLITIHHEMGHIEYFMQYKDQPTVYRDGANPGFHEAIGDLLALSVSTPKHLKKLGLLDFDESDTVTMTKTNLKFQLKMALDKVAFLPFGYLMDKYRWDVFSGETSSNDLNRHWWELRGQYQGLSPPVIRTENDFDPGAKYHIPASVEYIRYFVSHILQFQFHKTLCSFSQKNEPLYECDIDSDLEAGNILKEMLQKGSSQKWPDILQAMIGTNKMDVGPLLEYFQPLEQFLDTELAAAGVKPGWSFNVCEYMSDVDCPSFDETEGEKYLNTTNTELAKQLRIFTLAQWNYATNINDETSAAQINATKNFNDFQKLQSEETLKYNWTNFKEYNQRQFEKLAVIGTSALDKEDEDWYTNVTNQMETIYSSATVNINGKDLPLDPGLEDIMASSTDYDLLSEVWVKWRDASGKKMRNDFITYYTLGNKAATENVLPNMKFDTLDDLWLFPWETPTIKSDTADLWNQLKPFYEKIHAYVRMKLNIKYPGKLPKDGTIPAHLLGNMWAQQWSNIMNATGLDPYPDVPPIDVSESLKRQNKTALDMFHMSDEFFANLGLEKMTQLFWNNSVLVKKDNVTMVCHASAWDFYTTDDFRIKQCTDIDMEDLITIHHEMGHIEYFMQYKDQPTVYRDGANPGFHEAIGDLLALSVSTPKHLKKLGLLDFDESDTVTMNRTNLKFQLKMALDKVAFLPFGYIMDKYRWDVFSGETSSNDLNRHWWELRGQYQGLSPPVKRTENDFDPGAKYHIPASVEYIRYFVSHILQFQFHKTLCNFTQKNEPLYECDIDSDLEAGNILKEMLQKGSSQKWPDILQAMIGTNKMDVGPLLEYFQPLEQFLDAELAAAGVKPGWSFSVCDYMSDCSSFAIGSNLINVFSLIASVLISITFIIM